MSNIGFIKNKNHATLVIGSEVYTIAVDHPRFEDIEEAYYEGDVEELKDILDIGHKVREFFGGLVSVSGNVIHYNGQDISFSNIGKRVLEYIRKGQQHLAEPLLNFLKNISENPSFRATQGLYNWLEASNLPLTPDGHFIAWKIVNEDYTDIHTGQIDNSVGQVVEMPRSSVDEGPDRTCSSGLHFCSNDYLPHYGRGGRRVMILKINPRDAVAFPRDYNLAKGRCCRYEVIGEVEESAIDGYFSEDEPIYEACPKVSSLETRSYRDRQEIDLRFEDGTVKKTKVRLGDTVGFSQNGNEITLEPSGRTFKI